MPLIRPRGGTFSPEKVIYLPLGEGGAQRRMREI